MDLWCNGSTMVSKTNNAGSIPARSVASHLADLRCHSQVVKTQAFQA